MAKKGYTVKWDLDHNQKSYKEGDTVQLEDKEAEELLGFGVVSIAEKPKKSKAGGKKAAEEKAAEELKAAEEKSTAEGSAEGGDDQQSLDDLETPPSE